MATRSTEKRIPGWCALCRSRCGCISVVKDGRLTAVEPDPSHPTGTALCAKGRAAPELVYSRDRLLYPMKRTRPKGDPDPGWERISWDEALDRTAQAMQRLAKESDPESVAFSVTTPSGTSISDAIQWIERLMRAYGSPNNIYGTEICNWHKDFATAYTFGTGIGTPDFAHTGCIMLWGHNPGTAWLAKAIAATKAKARGAKLIVIDPRRVGLAAKADQWLRVRPGSDGALALGIAGVMLTEAWYDREFVRDWTNGPLLVRSDETRLLTEADLAPGGSAAKFVAWDASARGPVIYDPETASYEVPTSNLLLDGRVSVQTREGSIGCDTVFARYASLCRKYPPERVEAITWVPAEQIRATARLIWTSRPVSYYAWSGVGQHTNATQTDRAICLLYMLTGNYEDQGGNVHFSKVPMNDVSGADLMPERQRSKAVGFKERPLGPAKSWWVTSDDFYRAVLTHEPYRLRGLIGFGVNLLVSHADVDRGVEALKALEFYAHADLFLTPTAQFADVILPVNTAWERDALRVGFEIDQAANKLVQYRPQVVESLGESRSDTWIVFELAKRLGLGKQFWNGNIDAGYREVLEPSGVSLEALRKQPEGIRVPLETHYRAFTEKNGFNTPTRKIEMWSETFRTHGYPPLPAYVEPDMGPTSSPEFTKKYPFVLTSAKAHQFCHSQHRNLPRLRKLRPYPIVEIHPDTAAKCNIATDDWVSIVTPSGRIKARAALKDSLDPRVIAAQHGWWQACHELGLPGYDALSDEGTNFNRLIANEAFDPVSGSVSHRSYLCHISKWQGNEPGTKGAPRIDQGTPRPSA